MPCSSTSSTRATPTSSTMSYWSTTKNSTRRSSSNSSWRRAPPSCGRSRRIRSSRPWRTSWNVVTASPSSTTPGCGSPSSSRAKRAKPPSWGSTRATPGARRTRTTMRMGRGPASARPSGTWGGARLPLARRGHGARPGSQLRRPPGDRDSDVEENLDDVPVAHAVRLPLRAQLPVLARLGHRAQRQEVLAEHDLGPDEAAREVRVDGRGGVHGRVAIVDRPCARRVRADGEEADQPEQAVAEGEDAAEARRRQPELLAEDRRRFRVQLSDLH